MSFEKEITGLRRGYKLATHALDRQRTLLIYAQTDYRAQLGRGVMPDEARETFLQQCWSGSVQAQDVYSLRKPLEDPSLEGRRMLALAVTAGFQVLDQLQEAGVATDVLQTPAIYTRAWPRLMSGETFSPLALAQPIIEPVLESAA